MLDLYFTIHNKHQELMILDYDVLRTSSRLHSNRKCDCPLIIFVNCDCLFENTSQHCQDVFLKLEYKINLLRETHKR